MNVLSNAASLVAFAALAFASAGCIAPLAEPPRPPEAPILAHDGVLELSAGGGEAAREIVLALTPGVPTTGVRVQRGDKVAIVLPAYPGTDWTVAKADDALGTAREETLPGWLGPVIPGQKFVWSTADANEGGEDLAVEFVDRRGSARERVVIRVEAMGP